MTLVGESSSAVCVGAAWQVLLFTDSRPGLQALPEVKERWVRKVSELVVKMSADCHETASSDLLPECFSEFMHNVFSGAKQALKH